MDSLERLMSAAKPLPPALAGGNSLPRRALVHASIATTAAVGRRGRHLTGTFCLTGDTMEGIIQCLVFLKAFSVSSLCLLQIRPLFSILCVYLCIIPLPLLQ